MIHVFCNLEEEQDGHLPMCDMTFEIVEKRYDEAASCWHLAFRANASPYEPVAFGATIPICGWHAQVDGEDEEAFHSFWGRITLHSRGAESDRLLALMADYYGISSSQEGKRSILSRVFGRTTQAALGGWTFASKVECLCVGIESDPARLGDETVHLKLFFDEGTEDGRYAEVFLDIDLPSGFAALNEKDEEYRVDLVHWLSLPRT